MRTALRAATAFPEGVTGPVELAQGFQSWIAAACFARRSADQPQGWGRSGGEPIVRIFRTFFWSVMVRTASQFNGTCYDPPDLGGTNSPVWLSHQSAGMSPSRSTT